MFSLDTTVMLLSLKGLKKFLKKHAVGEELAVLDKKLGGIVQEKLGINCVYK
jgi:nucleolar protein 58